MLNLVLRFGVGWAKWHSQLKQSSQTLPAAGVFTYTNYTAHGVPFIVSVTGDMMHSNRLATMDQFVATTETLRSISQKELNKVPLSASESLFLQHLVEFSYGGIRAYTGWYPALFYKPGSEYVPPYIQDAPSGDNHGSDYWDALVTDVHTDPLDDIVGDPGSILHEGVGNVNLLMIAVDCGPGDTAAYAGPVLSHYEFELGPTTRKTDAQWKNEVRAGTLPPQPEWTRGYLVPRP
jgi:hypothetical protein